tara:strand:+ start:490 stop:705 length:216 start_codon:yes stop_codon:yes gene_type:complete
MNAYITLNVSDLINARVTGNQLRDGEWQVYTGGPPNSVSLYLTPTEAIKIGDAMYELAADLLERQREARDA